jgi:hypothetical protein
VFTDESVRSACGYTLQAIGQHNQDILKEHSSVVIPLVFFAMHANKIAGKIILLALVFTVFTAKFCHVNYSLWSDAVAMKTSQYFFR